MDLWVGKADRWLSHLSVPRGQCYHPFLPPDISAEARPSGTGPKLIQDPRLLFCDVTGSVLVRYNSENRKRAANLFPTSQGKQKALPACAGLSVCTPRRLAEEGGALAQRELLGVDGIRTCKMNPKEGKDDSLGLGGARPERHTGQRGKEDSFSVQNHHPNRAGGPERRLKKKVIFVEITDRRHCPTPGALLTS